MKTDEVRIEAKVENLPAVIAFATETLTGRCPPRSRMHVELVTEEIFVNIASYAYPETGGFVTIRRSGGEGPEGLTLTFIDGGVPYDPLQKPDPDLTLPLEERPIGGLGVFLVKELVDEVRYENKDGKNILTVRTIIGNDEE
ncbi:MAG: ATP-binding protein [Schwartzia sp.]|nr:ATP-binding protein [Schwartzia sp. (in: firmicutes)]MBR5163398.1 ATP-binding protein [Schwartzia sp. (in: firmicutes)]